MVGEADGTSAVDAASAADAVEDADDLAALRAELDAADALPLEERLAILERAEATLARALEGLDGL